MLEAAAWMAVRACGQLSTLLSSCGLSAPEVQNTETYSVKWSFIHIKKEPNNSVFAFSLYFCVFWVTIPCVFFSGSHSRMSPMSSLLQALVASSTLRWDSTATGAWGSCLHKGTGALGFGFFTQFKLWIFLLFSLKALQFKLWIFLLFLFSVCFPVNMYLSLPFTDLQKVQFPVCV